MGIYIEVPDKIYKAEQIIMLYGAEKITPHPTEIQRRDLSFVPEDKVLVCVVNNISFEAALIVGDDGELDRVASSIEDGDNRKLEWLLIDKQTVIENYPNTVSYFEW
jgi:hypothetical protein